MGKWSGQDRRQREPTRPLDSHRRGTAKTRRILACELLAQHRGGSLYAVTSSVSRHSLRPIHPFPARMAPAIVWEELPEVRRGSPICVLDPMAGSGTTVATARLLGHRAIGFDTDPLAVLIAKAWTSDVDLTAASRTASTVVRTARELARELPLADAYPVDADDETRAFVRNWFDHTSRRQLAALARAISAVTSSPLRCFLWCAFSRLIVVKSAGASLAMDVAHSRPHKVYDSAPIKPLRHFEKSAAVVARHLASTAGAGRPSASVRTGDARALPLKDGTVDFVITSPPYLNAIDYLRGHKFSLVWMGHSIAALRRVRAENVGTEVGAPQSARMQSAVHIAAALGRMGEIEGLAPRHLGMVRRYLMDMDKVIREIARVLKPRSPAVLVVGDSTLKGVFLRNSLALAELARRVGLRPQKRRRRALPPNRRYLPPPCSSRSGEPLTGRMRYEVIMRFVREP